MRSLFFAVTLAVLLHIAAAPGYANPIDADFNDVLQGLQQNDAQFRAQAYRNAWRGEVLNLANSEGTLDTNAEAFMQSLQNNAQAAAQSGDARAEAMIYRTAGLQMLAKVPNYSFMYPQNYTPLLQSLLACEVMHYDAFDKQPDAWTSACVISQMTVHHSRFAGAYVSATDDGRYIFPSALAPVTPARLYADSFADGKIATPPKDMPVASGTSARLVVQISNPPFSSNQVILSTSPQGERVTLNLDLSRVDNGDGAVTPLGQATVVLQKNPQASCGYTIVSFTPQYAKFKDNF